MHDSIYVSEAVLLYITKTKPCTQSLKPNPSSTDLIAYQLMSNSCPVLEFPIRPMMKESSESYPAVLNHPQ